MNKWLHTVLLIFCCASVSAEVISVAPEHEERFESILEELRCLVCQNQTVAESSSDLANDLRIEVKEMLEKGASDQEILDFMSDRYGDFVLYKPPVKPRTLLLWLGPFVLLVGGVLIVILMIKKRSQESSPKPLDENDRERLKRLLDEDDDNKK